MSQFRKADSSVYTTFLDMIEKVFPKLTGYSFGLLYRDKMKKSKGGLILAEICQPTKLLSYFAKNDNGNPFDFLIIVDEMAWCCSKESDRIRLMRHELRHVNVSEKGVARLIGHDYQDFYAEVDINVDDPTWCQKLVAVVMAGYDQVKDGQKDPRNEVQEGVTEMTKDPQRQTQLPTEDGGGISGETVIDIKPKGKETLSTDDKTDIAAGIPSTKASEKSAATAMEKMATELKKKSSTVVEMGKIRNKDGKLVTEVDDPEFLAGMEKGYGSA
jgi:hypothetical protein